MRARQLTATAYQSQLGSVRRALAGLGVRPADLADVCHDVFLVMYQANAVDQVVHLSAWLRQICRGVASNYRRRPCHAREELVSDLTVERLAQRSFVPDDAERVEELDLLRNVLGCLTHEQRELIALRHGRELPIWRIARLVGNDAKTVRKQLAGARRRLLAARAGGVTPKRAPSPRGPRFATTSTAWRG